MELEEIREGYRSEYQKECDICTMATTVYTQKFNDPEYETYIYVQCSCGNILEFTLPVN